MEGPAMKQLPARTCSSTVACRPRPVWSQALEPTAEALHSAVLVQLGDQPVKKYIQQPFPPAGNGFVINSGYDPFTVEFNGKYWTVFECAVAPANHVSACIAPLLPDLSGWTVPG
jgi:hypothetical protein